MNVLKRMLRGGMLLAVVVGLGFAAWKVFFHSEAKSPGRHTNGKAAAEAKVVKTVHPRREANFRIANRQMAMLQPLYQSGLKARVAGVVKTVARDIGSIVRKGEVLVEIDVPDLDQDVLQKEAVVEQRKAEQRMTEELYKHSVASLDVAKATVAQHKAEVGRDEANRDFRLKRLNRIRDLARRDSITPDVVDESEREYDSAVATVNAAKVAVTKAEVEILDKQAYLNAAQTEIELKKALVRVAERDLEKSRAMVEYSRILAPFDGVVTKRNVDAGNFVQNASTGTSESLLTVSRIDVVTAVVKLPDRSAPFVTDNTEAELELDDLPGVRIRGIISRHSPSIDPADRTMRLEMDIANGNRIEYERVRIQHALEQLTMNCQSPNWVAIAHCLPELIDDPQVEIPQMPIFPNGSDMARSGRRLVPGMTGFMRIFLDKFDDASLLPSSTVFASGGQSYILVVREGKAVVLPVRVQVNDGTMVKIGVREIDEATGIERIVELSETEEVVLSKQTEIVEGARVTASNTTW